MLSATENSKNESKPPIRQLCDQWVVKAWDEIPEIYFVRLGKHVDTKIRSNFKINFYLQMN